MCVLLAAAPDPRDRGPDNIDVATYPAKYQELYKVFEVRCTKCHSLARPVNARLKPDDWKLYIKKMSRRAGSGISESTGEQIYEFLRFYSLNKNNPDAGTAPEPSAQGGP